LITLRDSIRAHFGLKAKWRVVVDSFLLVVLVVRGAPHHA